MNFSKLQDEKERISNLGGEVIFWDGAYRVNGQLAVSRAIGAYHSNSRDVRHIIESEFNVV